MLIQTFVHKVASVQILVDYIPNCVTTLNYAFLFQRYNCTAFIRVVFLLPTFCALIVYVLIVFVVHSQSQICSSLSICYRSLINVYGYADV